MLNLIVSIVLSFNIVIIESLFLFVYYKKRKQKKLKSLMKQK